MFNTIPFCLIDEQLLSQLYFFIRSVFLQQLNYTNIRLNPWLIFSGYEAVTNDSLFPVIKEWHLDITVARLVETLSFKNVHSAEKENKEALYKKDTMECQRRKRALVLHAGNAQAELGRRCPLTESMDNVEYTDERKEAAVRYHSFAVWSGPGCSKRR